MDKKEMAYSITIQAAEHLYFQNEKIIPTHEAVSEFLHSQKKETDPEIVNSVVRILSALLQEKALQNPVYAQRIISLLPEQIQTQLMIAVRVMRGVTRRGKPNIFATTPPAPKKRKTKSRSA